MALAEGPEWLHRWFSKCESMNAGGPETLSEDAGGQNDHHHHHHHHNTRTLTAFALTFALMGKIASSSAQIIVVMSLHGHSNK